MLYLDLLLRELEQRLGQWSPGQPRAYRVFWETEALLLSLGETASHRKGNEIKEVEPLLFPVSLGIFKNSPQPPPPLSSLSQGLIGQLKSPGT